MFTRLEGRLQLLRFPMSSYRVPHYEHRRRSITLLMRESPLKNRESLRQESTNENVVGKLIACIFASSSAIGRPKAQRSIRSQSLSLSFALSLRRNIWQGIKNSLDGSLCGSLEKALSLSLRVSLGKSLSLSPIEMSWVWMHHGYLLRVIPVKNRERWDRMSTNGNIVESNFFAWFLKARSLSFSLCQSGSLSLSLSLSVSLSLFISLPISLSLCLSLSLALALSLSLSLMESLCISLSLSLSLSW